ncbi:MAG TPA: sensor histidine kinase [Azospirillaceae bacterium]|nr:sensor histidine kinase [Azospirillaceae bacterium]
MTLAKRIFAITFLIAGVALTGLTVLGFARATQILRDISLQRLSDGVDREARLLRNDLTLLKGDVLFLAATDVMDTLSRAMSVQNPSGEEVAAAEQRLARIFSIVMQQRPSYTQVRLVGLAGEGREVVRVNRVGGQPTIVTKAELQPKGDRYYLQEIARYRPGQVYLSPVDLNREHGRIVEPHQPVFRVATPVFGPEGTPVGTIIVNVDFDIFLRDLEPPVEGLFFVITDEHGEYLLHPDAGRRFAFEFGRSARLPDDYGMETAWRGWLAHGQAPLRHYARDRSTTLVLDRIDLDPVADNAERRLLVLAAISPLAMLESEATAYRQHLIVLALIVGALLAVALAMATSRLTRPIRGLTVAADRIAAGEADVDLDVRRRDETGLLAQALGRMLDSLRRAAKHEELASMGRMASMIAHDLRNALSAVKMNVQILARQEARTAPDQPHSRIALDRIQYMEHILTDMLIFARPDRLDADWVEVEDVVRAAFLAVLPAADAKQVNVLFGGLETLPRVHGDRTKLIRAVENLLDNAIQALPSGGRLSVSAQAVRGDGGPAVQLMIADNGEGIPPDALPQIFEPFFTTRSKGTGLGLAIVRRIVRQHGGEVQVESAPGRGTTVRIVLPVLPPDQTA